jgi:hypothetical protein
VMIDTCQKLRRREISAERMSTIRSSYRTWFLTKMHRYWCHCDTMHYHGLTTLTTATTKGKFFSEIWSNFFLLVLVVDFP